MDRDKFALVEKIIKDIENIMSKNAELNSFDIVPVDTNFRNKSPVLHYENSLGLESWCVKHVYMYCYTEIMDKYFSKPKRKSLSVTGVNAERLVKLTNVTLLLNPELSTLWNRRREMVQNNLIEKVKELQLTTLVLSRKPKCNDAFSYRRWLLEIILQDESLQSNYIEDLLSGELYICQISSEKSPNNYHSWSHRMWLLQTLKSINKLDLNSLFIREYEFSQQWTAKHVSDFSCFHYRQFCMKNIFQMNTELSWKTLEGVVNANVRDGFIRVVATNFPENTNFEVSEEYLNCLSDDKLITLLLGETFKNCNCPKNNFTLRCRLEILFHELVLNNELIRFYKHHETLWYHRRFIVHELLVAMYDYFGFLRQNGVLVKTFCKQCQQDELREKQIKIVRYDSSSIYSTIFFNVLLKHEQEFSEERQCDGDNYADRHKKYLKFVEGLNSL